MKFHKIQSQRVINFSKLIVTVVFLMFIDVSIEPVYSQTLPTPFIGKVQSLFSEDTCAPPCWFGLTVGKSTAADAKQMFETHSDLFFTDFVRDQDGILTAVLDLQPLIDGEGLSFYWFRMNQESWLNYDNFVEITNGTISNLIVQINDKVSLETTLEKLGKSSKVLVERSVYEDHLYLYYDDMHLIIDLLTDKGVCTKGVSNEFEVNMLEYMTDEGYREKLAAERKVLNYIPTRIWESWQHSASDKLSCLSVLDEIVK